jgi:hypothetical protein
VNIADATRRVRTVALVLEAMAEMAAGGVVPDVRLIRSLAVCARRAVADLEDAA